MLVSHIDRTTDKVGLLTTNYCRHFQAELLCFRQSVDWGAKRNKSTLFSGRKIKPWETCPGFSKVEHYRYPPDKSPTSMDSVVCFVNPYPLDLQSDLFFITNCLADYEHILPV